jgi:hypothetical protein
MASWGLGSAIRSLGKTVLARPVFHLVQGEAWR